MGTYRTAAVCRRGHTYASDVSYSPPAERCDKCGAKILTACPQCGAPLRGRYHVDGVVSLGKTYTPPEFCYSCGGPLPWASRQARIYELQNLLDEEDLSEADRLSASELLASLQVPDLDEEKQVEKWLKLKKLAPGLLTSGQKIIETVVSAAIKTQLGLP